MGFFTKKQDNKKDNKKIMPLEKEMVALPKARKTENTEKTTSQEKRGSHLSYRILVHPLLTEKSTIQNSYNQYVFMVNARANKTEIKKALQETYHVKPLKVRIINNLGKAVRSGRGKTNHLKDWKKAIVSLPAGKKIDVYEGV